MVAATYIVPHGTQSVCRDDQILLWPARNVEYLIHDSVRRLIDRAMHNIAGQECLKVEESQQSDHLVEQV